MADLRMDTAQVEAAVKRLKAASKTLQAEVKSANKVTQSADWTGKWRQKFLTELGKIEKASNNLGAGIDEASATLAKQRQATIQQFGG